MKILFYFNIIKKHTKNLMEIFTKKFIKKKIFINYFTSYSNLKKQDLQVFREIMKYMRLHSHLIYFFL